MWIRDKYEITCILNEELRESITKKTNATRRRWPTRDDVTRGDVCDGK